MIRSDKVRVIDADGKQLGILTLQEALAAASEQGLDLVEVSPNADPPVCRLMDYGKFKYQQSKKLHKKTVQNIVHVKEIKLRPYTGKHDLEVKTRHILEFLDKGHKVKVSVVFRGREILHQEHGTAILQQITAAIQDSGLIEQDAHMEGRNIIVLLCPKKQKTS
jgi:translation initiation factor IF-3